MLADPDEAQAQALTARLIAAMERPALICSSDLSVCEQLLSTAGLPKEVYDRALSLVAAVIYWRPDLVSTQIVPGLGSLFADHSLSAPIHRHAGELLEPLLATPAAPHALDLLLRMLARPGRPSTEYSVLLDSLAYASSWAVSRLDLGGLIALAEAEHLAGQRERLLHEAIERAMFARPASVTDHLLERLVRLYEGHPSLKYLLYYLAGRADVPATVRSAAKASVTGQFPLHDLVHQRLGSGMPWVLIVQNIADAQGDEIIRVVPLIESLLCLNPLLELVLITNREYLYAHSRITLVPIDDRASVQSVLRDRFDAVINFYEPTVPQVNYDQELEHQVAACVQTHAPFLQVGSQKGWNTFLYQRVDVQSRAHADTLGLGRQRVENVYETTFRLVAELGLPLRLGEETPGADSVLAGLPCPEAEAAWSALLERNTQRRPAALLCPFGGAEPLKGYVERQANLLADQIRRLIVEGFYVVLLPNGMPWGSASHAHKVVGHLAPSEQEQIVVAPDPADGRGAVRYEHAGRHAVPYASYRMRLVTYFVRFADLVVTVEGWMVHAAYCLGKRYRVLMLPDSYPSGWHPYGRTLHQDVVVPAPGLVPSAEEVIAPPLPAQPRKFVLLFLLRSLGRSGDARAVPVLRWALRSEDWHVRLAAAQSLGRFSGPDVDAALRALLADPANRVRGAAATALLERTADAPPSADEPPREHLLAHQLIGREPRDWVAVLRLGESARSALQTAVRDDHPVVRREAAWAMQVLDRRLVRARLAKPPALPGRVSEPARELLRAGKSGSARLAALLRDLSRRAAPRSARSTELPTVLVLTPVKDAADCLDRYCKLLLRMTYPHGLISLGFLESDSSDTTFRDLERRLPALRAEFRRVGLWKKDFGYRIPPGLPRWAPSIQVERRSVLAKSRNYLLFRALDDEAWVLWLDVDVVEYPPDLIERLLATGKEIVQPHCVLEYGGPTFDLNGWRDHGRLHLDDLRDEGELVELDAVGATVLLVRADLHREGLVYPPFLYGAANPLARTGTRQYVDGVALAGEIETEGLGIMARDMGHRCWGMPRFEVIHRRK